MTTTEVLLTKVTATSTCSWTCHHCSPTSTGRRRSSPSLMSCCPRREPVRHVAVELTWNQRRDESCPLPMLPAHAALCSVSFLVAAVFFTFRLILTLGTKPIILFTVHLIWLINYLRLLTVCSLANILVYLFSLPFNELC